MKLMKRILAIVCTFVMIISMATGVNAVDDKSTTATSTPERGKITVTQAISGEDYKIYKLLSLESYDKSSGAYSYKKPGGDWNNYIENEGQQFFQSNNNGYITLKTNNETEARKLAMAAIAYAKKNSIEPTRIKTASVSKEEETTVVFDDLDLGYYVVESTSGTACAIATTDPEVTIENKHKNPYVQKKIINGGKVNDEGTQNSVNLGQVVTFQTTIYVKPGARNYVLHDKMYKNLQFQCVQDVNGNDNRKFYANKADADYIVKPDPFHKTDGPTDGCTFHVEFTPKFYEKYQKDIDEGRLTEIYVSYVAQVTDTAPVKTAMKNTTYLTYGEKGTKSSKSETKTYTYSIPVFKYTGIDTPLANAKFILSEVENAAESDAINFVSNGSFYRYSTDQRKGNKTLTSGTNGRVDIEGLQEGVYFLKEIEAPKGYNKIQKSIKIEILSDGNIKVNDAAITGDVKVENNTGSVLPSTGGMGTTLIYVVGSILVLASGIVLFSKRKEGTN